MKNILVILGHPRAESFCAALAQQYAQSARAAGADVRLLNLAELPFDPVLHGGYVSPQTLESSLVSAQADITWAQHIVLVYPNWWGTFPALLKGFFDRVFLPGFAFRYRKDSPMWDKLLAGRSARVLVTMDSPSWYYRWIVGAPGDKQIRKSILQFCGINPVQISHLGPIRGASEAKRAAWLTQVAELARRDV